MPRLISDTYGVQVNLHFSEQGFTMSAKTDDLEDQEMPSDFRNVQKKKNK
jgi:hypothetical protein